jgi:putative FmdB family regulatory protein
MPFYEYECPHCRFHQEVLQKISDKPLKKCPNCGKSGLKKLMSAPVFRLKGSGWYETDFKSDKENKRNLAGPEKEEKAETKPDAKVEAKTDAKPDAGKAEPAKADTAKADTAKAVPAKSAEPTARSSSARKTTSRVKTKARTAKRPTRR